MPGQQVRLLHLSVSFVVLSANALPSHDRTSLAIVLRKDAMAVKENAKAPLFENGGCEMINKKTAAQFEQMQDPKNGNRPKLNVLRDLENTNDELGEMAKAETKCVLLHLCVSFVELPANLARSSQTLPCFQL